MAEAPHKKEDDQEHHQQRVEVRLPGDFTVVAATWRGVKVSMRGVEIRVNNDVSRRIAQWRFHKNEVRMRMRMAGITQRAPTQKRENEGKERSKK